MGASSYSALLAKAGVVATAFAVAFTGLPTAGAEPVDATATDGTLVEETGLAPHDSQWTSKDSNGEISVVPGAAGAPDTAPGESAYTELNQEMSTSLSRNSSPVIEDEQPPTLDPLLPQKTDQAETYEISVHRDGISDEGDQIYRLDATVEFSPAETVGTDDVSFLRRNATAEIADIESVTINNTKVDVTEDVELFSYPRPGSGVFLPHPWPKDVTGDMITIDTQDADLTEETSFSVTFTLKDDTQDEAPWKLYTGQDTAKTLNEKLDGAKPEARFSGRVPQDQVRVVVQVGGDKLLTGRNVAAIGNGRRSAMSTYSGEPGAVLQLYEPLDNKPFGNREAVQGNKADDNPMVPVNEDWAKCTSDRNGTCVFNIPTSGKGTHPYYWIGMTKASPGFEIQKVFRAGGSGDRKTRREDLFRYAIATPNIPSRGGETLYSGALYHKDKNPPRKERNWGSDWHIGGTPASFMYEVDGRKDDDHANNNLLWERNSMGVFMQRRANPPLPQRCGLRVGFIVDTSTSMGGEGMETINKIFVGSDGVLKKLAEANVEVGLFSFNNTSPSLIHKTGKRVGYIKDITDPINLNLDNNLSAAEKWVKSLETGEVGGTNWELGLKRVVEFNNRAEPNYDVVFLITDGNPTFKETGNTYAPFWGGDGSIDGTQSAGFDNVLGDVEAAMGMANTLKSQGTRIVPVGIPSKWILKSKSKKEQSLDVAENNLEAVSGDIGVHNKKVLRKEDFATFTDSDVFRQALINTLANCSITVERRFYERNDDPAEGPTRDNTRKTTASENNGWKYDGILKPENRPEEKKTVEPQLVPDDDTYQGIFELNGETPYSEVEIREHKKVPDGWQRMPTRDGKNAQCFDVNKNPVAVTNLDQSGEPPTNDFKLNNVPRVGGIHCIVYYRKPAQPTGFNFRITKVDADNNAASLDGAKFELRPLHDDGSPGSPIANADSTTPESNKFEWSDLKPGRYVLTETQSPSAQDGKTYSLLAQPIYFSVTAEGDGYKVKLLKNAQDQTGNELNQQNLTFPIVGFNLKDKQAGQPQLLEFTVANVHVGSLPMSGSFGVFPWILAGLTAMVLGGTMARKRLR